MALENQENSTAILNNNNESNTSDVHPNVIGIDNGKQAEKIGDVPRVVKNDSREQGAVTNMVIDLSSTESTDKAHDASQPGHTSGSHHEAVAKVDPSGGNNGESNNNKKPTTVPASQIRPTSKTDETSKKRPVSNLETLPEPKNKVARISSPASNAYNTNGVETSRAPQNVQDPTIVAASSLQKAPSAIQDSKNDAKSIQAGSSSESVQKTGANSKDASPEYDSFFASLVDLRPVRSLGDLPMLTPKDLAQLEMALQIGDKFSDYCEESSWREDWNGNLQLIDKEIVLNRDALAQKETAKVITIPFCEWVAKHARHSDDFVGVNLLFRYIYHMKDIPLMAQRIMSSYLLRSATSVTVRLEFILEAVRRISYDPVVLTQDGWTTAKADTPDGETGGAYLIGRRVIWHRYEAVVIAFVRDEELGDLWKCLWLEDHDTFDLEADELQEGMKKWERKQSTKEQKQVARAKPTASARFEANRNFTVDGIEDGIILASSYNVKASRPWPARIMHAKEAQALGSSSRRSSSKNEIHVVFLAPYWNHTTKGQRRDKKPQETPTGTSVYSTMPLFQWESIEVSEETVKKYPYDCGEGSLSVDKLRTEFKFLGLPKAAFPRYLDSHRMAISLKAYARAERKKASNSIDKNTSQAAAFASLTDTHPLSIRTPLFPDALLNLPFEYILSKCPHPSGQVSQFIGGDSEEVKEPIFQLHTMLKALIPPNCWGQQHIEGKQNSTPKRILQNCSTPYSRGLTPIDSPAINVARDIFSKDSTTRSIWTVKDFASDYLLRHIGGSTEAEEAKVLIFQHLGKQLADMVASLNQSVSAVESSSSFDLRESRLRNFLSVCITAKTNGEDNFYAFHAPQDMNLRNLVLEWRKSFERIFRSAVVRMGHVSSGNGVTAVITDFRCNQHITASGSFERAVRLPAAIKGAKNAGAGSSRIPLVTKIEEKYMDLAEEKIMPKAHNGSYLKRIKDKIAALPPDAKGVPLTDDSDGEGGEDTMGSRGSYTAAVVGVASAIQAVDMVMSGKCVNAFCAVRPPGHHAGRELRPMNAVSNGFCLLNAAACAALYATSPRVEGGFALKRVCVIDIDVHHGNGTQDILCSTNDSRFLYISTHAGGAHINGYDDENSDDDMARRSLNTRKDEGIFPGRCGDSSPHSGVLNLPLGAKVTPHAIGNALASEVFSAVEQFSPELIIISAGFDAHKNDPLGLGSLSAEDFGSVTQVICQMALKVCSGRVISILEGGYGVPCCRPPQKELFLPDNEKSQQNNAPGKILDLGDNLPDSMEDNIDPALRQKLEKCHQEGFLECVREHVSHLAKCSNIDPKANMSKQT